MKSAPTMLAVFLLTIGIVAQQPTPSPEQSPQLFLILDRNGDNQLSQDEAQGGLRDSFPLIDSNGDGGIDLNELTRFLETTSQGNLNPYEPIRLGFEILNFVSPQEILVWVSRDISVEQFDALELTPGWGKNQPRESDPDRSRFLRSPGAEVNGPLLAEDHFGYTWMHNATVVENNIPMDSGGLLVGRRIAKHHELTYLSGRTVYLLVSPENQYFIRVSRDLNRTSDDPTIPQGWQIIETVLDKELVLQLPNPALNIRGDNEDSFQGPISAEDLGIEEGKTLFLDKVIGQHDIVVTSDIWYGNGDPSPNSPMYLDAYQPFSPLLPSMRPALVYIHGGAFITGDKADQPAPLFCYEFAQRGYVVFSINYALDGNLDPATQDTARAIRWVRKNAKTFNLDPDRIIVGGHSAGAAVALNISVTEASGLGGEGAEVAGALNSAGADFVDLSRLDNHDPPILIINGVEDALSPVGRARNLVKSLDNLQKESDGTSFKYSYLEVENAGHSFIPGSGIGITPLPIAGSPQDEFQGWSNTEVEDKTVDRHCFEFFFEHLNLIRVLGESPMAFERNTEISDNNNFIRIAVQWDSRVNYSVNSSSDLRSWNPLPEILKRNGKLLEAEIPLKSTWDFFRWDILHDYREITSEDYDTF